MALPFRSHYTAKKDFWEKSGGADARPRGKS
jgi:hypothetical protein